MMMMTDFKKGVLGETRGKTSEIAGEMAFWGYLEHNKQKHTKKSRNQKRQGFGQQHQQQQEQ